MPETTDGLRASDIKKRLQDFGVLHDFSLHPSKMTCNNCGETIEFDHPNVLSLMEKTTSEILWCPNCGD